jgi:hypothetical protein
MSHTEHVDVVGASGVHVPCVHTGTSQVSPVNPVRAQRHACDVELHVPPFLQYGSHMGLRASSEFVHRCAVGDAR